MLEPVKPLTTLHAQPLRRPGGVFHRLGRPGIHAGRIAVAPHVRRQDRLVTGVDVVQDRLPDQVIADREHL